MKLLTRSLRALRLAWRASVPKGDGVELSAVRRRMGALCLACIGGSVLHCDYRVDVALCDHN
jgi:hypothetical protein